MQQAKSNLPLKESEIRRVINVLYPDAQSIRHIDRGHENLIFVVDDQFVMRFPRSSLVWERTRLERFIISRLSSPIVPNIIRYSDTPPYMVQTFLPGEHMSVKEFRRLTVAAQQNLGNQIAEFAYGVHDSISVAEFMNESSKLISPDAADGSYGDYLREMLYDYSFPTAAQNEVAKHYFKAWLAIRESKPVVVHDDLHVDNLLMRNQQLSGVIDFGATCVGTAEQELRQVYRLSNEALISAINTYNSLASTELDAEVARTWATTQELATYARELQSDHKHQEAFERARDYLSLWLPHAFK